MSKKRELAFCEGRLYSMLTVHEVVHSQDTREDSLVVTIEKPSNTGEAGNAEDSEVLNQSHGS